MSSWINVKAVVLAATLVILLQTSAAHLQAQETQFTVQALAMWRGDTITLSGFPNALITRVDFLGNGINCADSPYAVADLSHNGVNYIFSGRLESCFFTIFGSCYPCERTIISGSTNVFNGLPVNGDYTFARCNDCGGFEDLRVTVDYEINDSPGVPGVFDVSTIITNFLLDD